MVFVLSRWYLYRVLIVRTESKAYLYTHFLDNMHFSQKHNKHTLIVFSIAKGLATCRLGGGGGGV